VRPLWFCLAEGALWFTIRLEARRTGADPPCSRSLPAPTIIASAEPRSNAITNRSAGAPPLIAADDVSTPSSAAIPSTDVTKFP
jgi:hypothetical protein